MKLFGRKPKASSPADQREFHLTVGGNPYHFVQKGKNIQYGGLIYKFVGDKANRNNIAMLSIDGQDIDNVTDPALRDCLAEIFCRENPELAHLIPGGSPAPSSPESTGDENDRPETFNLTNTETGEKRTVKAIARVNLEGKTYVVTTPLDSQRPIMVFEDLGDGAIVGADLDIAHAVVDVLLDQNPDVFN